MPDNISDNVSDSKSNKTPQGLSIEKIYVKDVSFEAPNVPEIFQNEWKPTISLNMDVKTSVLSKEKDVYEVVLKLTVTNKSNEKVVFLTEVSQAGIFSIRGFQQEQLKAIMAVPCLQILFPYAREAISDLTGRAGFPPLYLAPINFEALYQQQLESEKDKGTVH